MLLLADKKNRKLKKANQKEKTSQELKSTSLRITKRKLNRTRSKLKMRRSKWWRKRRKLIKRGRKLKMSKKRRKCKKWRKKRRKCRKWRNKRRKLRMMKLQMILAIANATTETSNKNIYLYKGRRTCTHYSRAEILSEPSHTKWRCENHSDARSSSPDQPVRFTDSFA